MVLLMNQDRGGFNWNFHVIDTKGNDIADINTNTNGNSFKAKINYYDNKINNSNELLYFNTKDKSFGSSIKDRHSFKILNGNNKIGSIGKYTEVYKFPKYYDYYKMDYNGINYIVYLVGLHKCGKFLCVYEGDRKVAVIKKEIKVVDNKDEYILYIDKDDDLNICLIFTVYYDLLEFLNNDEEYSKGVNISTLQTYGIVNEKLDISFIEMIINRDE